MAAKLGDPDAQQELAFCFLNGKGCKKDKKEAAKWYRAAVSFLLNFYGLLFEVGRLMIGFVEFRLRKELVMSAWLGFSRTSTCERSLGLECRSLSASSTF